ncbi:rhomboid family intramembrane serine protease [Rhizobium sp.]
MTLSNEKIDRPDDLPPAREPIFNIPGILLLYAAVMAIIQAVRSYVLTPEQDQWLVYSAAFFPPRYLHPLDSQDMLGYFLGPVGYSFLHGGWAHLGSNALFLVIFATPLVARIGAIRFTVLWITSAAAAAFFQGALTGFEISVLVGASGVVSAMAGASCRFVMPLLGSDRVRAAQYAPRLGMIEALGKRSVISFIVFWMIFNVVVAGVDSSQNIAWQAHLGGFLFGYLTFGLFDPPLRH